VACPEGEKRLVELGNNSTCTSTHHMEKHSFCKGCRSIWSEPRPAPWDQLIESAPCEDWRVDAGNDFLEGALARPHAERKAMIDRSHDLPLVKQAKASDKPRQRLSLPRPVFGGRSASCGAWTSCIWIIRSLQPDARDLLALEGIKTGRLHVATLMKRMAIEAIYRKPNTSKPMPGTRFIRISCAICL